MNRNWYAALLICLLGVALFFSARFMDQSVPGLDRDLENAYACALNEDFATAKTAFHAAAAQAEQVSRLWFLLVRRSLVDQLNQTLATLPAYCSRENLSDLAVEVARARAQLRQLRQSFFGCL